MPFSISRASTAGSAAEIKEHISAAERAHYAGGKVYHPTLTEVLETVHEHGLLIKTKDADRFYLALNRIALNGIQIESVAPADDDVNSVYEYLIGSDEVAR